MSHNYPKTWRETKQTRDRWYHYVLAVALCAGIACGMLVAASDQLAARQPAPTPIHAAK